MKTLDRDALLGLRREVYLERGYSVVRGFIEPRVARYIRDFWDGGHGVLVDNLDKARLFYRGCPNYSWRPAGRKVHVNFFWNDAIDECSYEVAWRIQQLRNQIEGNPQGAGFLPVRDGQLGYADGALPGARTACAFRVVGTTEGGGIEPHRDWLHDLSKVQMSLVLSRHGEDYAAGGFGLRTKDGVERNLSVEAALEPGDLLVFHYSSEHSVRSVATAPGGRGFWRVLFPLETIQRHAPIGRALADVSRQLSGEDTPAAARLGLAARVRRQVGAARRRLTAPLAKRAHSQAPARPVDGGPPAEDLKELIALAIAKGQDPSDVFYQRGLFGRWHVFQDWQDQTLRTLGLRPEHHLLDIGCGPARLGLKLVDYLEDDHYCGIDPLPNYVALADEYLRRFSTTKRRYRLKTSAAFEFGAFERRFDFAVAHSVFTHLSLAEIERCLRALAPVMRPGGKLLFTVVLDPSLGADLEETFLYDSVSPMVHTTHRDDALFRRLAAELGFTLAQLPDAAHLSQAVFVAQFGT